MSTITIIIPANVRFGDLHLARCASTGDMAFDWAPIEAICAASGVDLAMFQHQDEDHVAGLLATWYRQHLDQGGD